MSLESTLVPAGKQATGPARTAAGQHCCLHLGLPKTATTMLQLHVFAEHSQIWFLGKFAHDREHFLDAEVDRLSADIASARSSATGETRQSLRARLAAARSEGKVPVWSKEGMTGGAADKKRRQAELLREAFGECKVIITVREPLSFVDSLYFQQLRAFQMMKNAYDVLRRRLGSAPRYFDINMWLDCVWDQPSQNVLGHLKYADTAEIYADVFGKEQVGLFVFEQLKRDPAAYLRGMCQFMGIDPAEGQRLGSGQRTNTRWSQAPVNRLKAIEGSVLERWQFRLASKAQRKQMLGLRVDLEGRSGPRARSELSPAWRERLLDVGRQQAQQLVGAWGLPLAEYGYPV